MEDEPADTTPPGDPEASDLPSTHTEGPAGAPAGTVGPYRLLQKVGEGGMGEVWLAEQTEPVRRRVAVKVIKQGMDTKQVVARFEAERQALAMMDHPAVAKVFEAGSTPEGRPYFVMEYVAGVPITDYCDGNKLTTRERLDLFLQVCEGVQHAHQKAIIHRDLKPSNVLVFVQNGRAFPKIIDFGVAKATAQRLTERTVFTELGVLIGTPEYMSPEQADLTGLDVDTRTDVYSLGVMLYELLVGALPFESKDLRSAGLDGIRRKILEEDPQKPSTRLSTLADDRSTESARHRRVDVPTLRRQLSGDLDWITMRALEKDRTRRYGSPADLAADIERHLSDQPVLAGPPSRTYRARKFVRRHRVGVAVAASGALVLIAFATTMAVQAGRIVRERDRANREAETARRVSDFLTDLFSQSDPRQAQGKDLTAKQILKRGVERIGRELEDQPAVKARLLRTLGTVHDRLAIYDKAEELLKDSLARFQKLFGEDDVETLRSAAALAWLYRDRNRPAEAEKLLRRVIDARRRLLGEEHPDTLKATSDLAVVISEEGRDAEAETLDRQVLEVQQRVLGEEHPDTLTSYNNLGAVVLSQNRYAEAETLLRRGHEGRLRVLGPDHPATLLSLANLSMAVNRLGRDVETEKLIRQAYESHRRVFGDDHPETVGTLFGLAGAVYNLGRYEEAEKLWRQVYDGARRNDGDDDPGTLFALHSLGSTLGMEGRYTEAEAVQRKVLEARRRVLGEGDPDTAGTMGALGATLLALGRRPEADKLLERAVEILRGVKGAKELPTVSTLVNLGYAISRQGSPGDAEPLYREALEKSRRLTGEKSDRTARVLYKIARSDALQGRRDQALDFLKQAVDAGYAHPGIRDEKDLASLRGDPRFEAMADEIEGRIGDAAPKQ